VRLLKRVCCVCGFIVCDSHGLGAVHELGKSLGLTQTVRPSSLIQDKRTEPTMEGLSHPGQHLQRKAGEGFLSFFIEQA
jgi:hypothetical protein